VRIAWSPRRCASGRTFSSRLDPALDLLICIDNILTLVAVRVVDERIGETSIFAVRIGGTTVPEFFALQHLRAFVGLAFDTPPINGRTGTGRDGPVTHGSAFDFRMAFRAASGSRALPF
jgi:hypothetical protein